MNKLKSIVFATVATISILVASAVPAGMASAADTPTWATKPPLPSTSMGVEAVTGPDGKIYAISGYNSAGLQPDLNIYTPSTNSWTTKTMPHAHLDGGLAFGNDGILYVIAGCNDDCFAGKVDAYNPTTDTWTAKADLPDPRSGQAVAAVNGKIYALGGYALRDTDFSAVDSVHEYNPATDTWTQKANAPTPRMQTAAAVLNGKIYVVGGRHINLPPTPPDCLYDRCNVVEVYDPATDTWTTKNPFPEYLSGIGMTVASGSIYAVGGNNGGPASDDVYKYAPASDSWSVVAQMPTPRAYLGAATLPDNSILTIGGISVDTSNNSIIFYDTVEQLSFIPDDTTPPVITATKSPAANTYGWNNSDVTVFHTCTDNIAVASCSGSTVISNNGAGQTVTGTATDTAGNSATTSTTVNLDNAAPTTSAPTLSANLVFLAGNLTISATATDQAGLSGIEKGLYYLDVDPATNPAAVGTNMVYSATTGKVTATKNITFGSLSRGRHTIYIRTIDKAGNFSGVVSVSFIYI